MRISSTQRTAAIVLFLLAVVVLPAGAEEGIVPAPMRQEQLSRWSDDWEPAVAATDDGRVIIATTRYSIKAQCDDCPSPAIVYKTSNDSGATWTVRQRLCRCEGSDGQYDPVFASDDQNRLFVIWLDGYRPGVMFMRSTDWGKSWSQPEAVATPKVFWSDKPWVDSSDDGEDVYITFNGERHGWEWVVASHDAGKTWGTPQLVPHAHPRFSRYSFASGMTVLPDGTALAALNSWRQKYHVGNVLLQVARSDDDGKTWKNIDIEESAHGRECPGFGHCRWGFLGPQIASAADAEGTAYILYNTFDEPNGPSVMRFRSSSDAGLTWSDAIPVAGLSAEGSDELFPIIAATGDGDVRIAWMDNRTGGWNTWYRRSTDGGKTWGQELQLSNRIGGAPYKSETGFHFPYGDYGQMAIDGDNASIVTWGEGPSWYGPGGTWWSRVPADASK